MISELEVLINSVSDPTGIVDVQDQMLSWSFINSAAEYQFGIQKNYYTGRPVTDFSDLESYRVPQRMQTLAEMQQCVIEGKAVSSKRRYQRSDGFSRWARRGIVPFFSDAGEVEHLILTCTNIPEPSAMQSLTPVDYSAQNGFIDVCKLCSQVRHNGEWQSIERYVAEQTEFHDFTTSLCLACSI